MINNKVVYALDLCLFYLLVYLKHNRDALPKKLKKKQLRHTIAQVVS
jgi:hypothetical protein